MLTVRKISLPDMAKYYAIRVLSNHEFPQYVGPAAELELMAGQDGIAELFNKYDGQGHYVYGAFDNEELVGVSALTVKKSNKFSHKAFLWGMYILEEYRGKSVSSLLMQHGMSWSRNKGLLAVQLCVTESNNRAKKLYERYDFEVYGKESDGLYADDEYHNIYFMEVRIKNRIERREDDVTKST